jgi:hypothetical protein
MKALNSTDKPIKSPQIYAFTGLSTLQTNKKYFNELIRKQGAEIFSCQLARLFL